MIEAWASRGLLSVLSVTETGQYDDKCGAADPLRYVVDGERVFVRRKVVSAPILEKHIKFR